MDIGLKIKEIRESQNISMTSLSKMCEVSQANLSRIERGQQQPAFDTLNRIINALGFTVVDFFTLDNSDLEPDLKILLNTLKSFTPEQRQALQYFLDSIKIK